MTDHAGLLRQIRTEARPYIEHALELTEVFTGFRKLASENGLDWGVIKALIKAELQDEKEGGTIKVDRIIDKADFASAYADMLGLGTAKMNENNFSAEQKGVSTPSSTLPPHDEDGVIIEPETAKPVTVGEGLIIAAGLLGDASPTLSDIGIPISIQPAVAESAPAEAGQGEGSLVASSVALSRGEGVALHEPSPQINSVGRPKPEGMTALPEERGVPIQQAGPHDGGSHEVAALRLKTFAEDISSDEPVVPSGADAGSAVQVGAPNSNPIASPAMAAPVEPVSSLVEAPGAPSYEILPLPDFLNRRLVAA